MLARSPDRHVEELPLAGDAAKAHRAERGEVGAGGQIPDGSGHDDIPIRGHPDWYYNLTADGEGSVDRGTETYRVTVRDVIGDERDRIYSEQARRYPGFAEYERQTEGIRTIPVLELRRT